MKRRRARKHPLRALLASVVAPIRLALFGPTRPRKALAGLFRRPSEVIDPAAADPRAVLPASPPVEWVDKAGDDSPRAPETTQTRR